jgi:hypothetical protein
MIMDIEFRRLETPELENIFSVVNSTGIGL